MSPYTSCFENTGIHSKIITKTDLFCLCLFNQKSFCLHLFCLETITKRHPRDVRNVVPQSTLVINSVTFPLVLRHQKISNNKKKYTYLVEENKETRSYTFRKENIPK